MGLLKLGNFLCMFGGENYDHGSDNLLIHSNWMLEEDISRLESLGYCSLDA